MSTFYIPFNQKGITGSIEVEATLNPDNTVTLKFTQSDFIADFQSIYIDFDAAAPTGLALP